MNDTDIPAAHRAIQLGKKGLLPGKQVLEQLVDGKVAVPIHELPRIEKGVITAWRPASVSKADGSQWIVAYTLSALAAAFCESNPATGLYVDVDTRWMLSMLPDSYGVVFNLRTPDMLEWNAAGLAKFKKDVLGW